jgi:hypothetical protein
LRLLTATGGLATEFAGRWCKSHMQPALSQEKDPVVKPGRGCE